MIMIILCKRMLNYIKLLKYIEEPYEIFYYSTFSNFQGFDLKK